MANIFMFFFITISLCQLFFVRSFSQSTNFANIDGEGEVYTLQPTDLTIAFSVSDR